jgi:hypothetical protein
MYIKTMRYHRHQTATPPNQLFEWGVPHQLWPKAKAAGLSPNEFGIFWRSFVTTHATATNIAGTPILSDPRLALRRATMVLRDVARTAADRGWVSVKPGWRVFINPDLAQRRRPAWTSSDYVW